MSTVEDTKEQLQSGPRHALQRGAVTTADDPMVPATVLVARYLADEGGPADGAVSSHAKS